MRKVLLVSLCIVLGSSAAALAGANVGVAKGTIHVRPHNAKAGCTVAISTCSDIVMSESGFSVDAFPVFYELNEFQGCEYGVTWPAWSYPAAFTSCSDFVIGAIANPGEGASHTWTACDYSGVCIPSFLWLYADGPGKICITGHPQHGSAFVLDCGEDVDVLIGWGCAGVYGGVPDPESGNACEALPGPATEPTTWGEIKSLFQ